MEEKAALILQKYINLSAYPLDNPEGEAYHALMDQVHEELARDGVSVLKNFIKSEWLPQLEAEGEAVSEKAYYRVDTVNAYNLPLDAPLPPEHPAKITMQRENAFVARDLIPEEFIIHELYEVPAFGQFVAACFCYDKLHQLADPLSGLVINVLRPGSSHPWHFDVNEFTVSLLTKQPQAGGVFYYCPDIRSPEDENLTAVKEVLSLHSEGLEGTESCAVPPRALVLEPGDLQLFKGRYALHHVAPVRGDKERHTAIFSFTKETGVIGSPERARQLFGRVLPAHEAAAEASVMTSTKSDGLLD
jgi:hypothetical protein